MLHALLRTDVRIEVARCRVESLSVIDPPEAMFDRVSEITAERTASDVCSLKTRSACKFRRVTWGK